MLPPTTTATPATATPPTPTYVLARRPGCLWPLVVLILGLATLALAAFLLLYRAGVQGLASMATPTERFTLAGQTINQVQALSLLTVQSVQVVSELEAEAAFRKGVWIVRGSADYAVDFSQARLTKRDEKSKELTVELPVPKLRNPRLDEERTKLVTYENTGLGWWTIGMAGSREQFEKSSRARMQAAVVAAARERPYIDLAKASAEKLVASIFDLAGWKVKVQWTGEP